jgi:hypothetical protein
MGWCATSDLDEFMAAAGGYLVSRAAENTLLLSAAQAARSGRHPRIAGRGPDADPGSGVLFGWWEPADGGDPRGAFLHDPAVPLLVSGRVPEMAASLAAALGKAGRHVSGVDAPTDAADAFAAAWSQRAGTMARVHRHCRVYRLTAGGGAWPASGMPGPVGRLRVAAAADQPLLAEWLTEFAAETADRAGPPADIAADLISYGGAILWEVPQWPGPVRDVAHNGGIPPHSGADPFGEPVHQPVALAALDLPVAGTVRISMVYTPQERRGSGYASAVTLAVSRAILAGGTLGDARGVLGGRAARDRVTEVVLITDKSRPDRWASRLGFQVAGERAVFRFGPVTGPVPRPAATGPGPRLPTGPLPRLPHLRR